MRNPIHKRLENLATWQHLTFMACLCERMYPNYHLFCQISKQPQNAKVYHNILNLVWEYLTVKDTKINFENQLEKLEDIIPDVNDYRCYGVIPALELSDTELKESDLIQQELDLQWQLYRVLNEAEKHDVALIQDLKNELREEKISNICIKIDH